jgi:putative transcriptional regulator
MNMKQQFLCSLPGLGDTNFNQSVLYVDNHDGDGAKGWIINKVLDSRVAVRLRKSIQLGIQADIYYGGPVETNQCYVLHTKDIMLAQSIKINENLCVTRDKAIITTLNENRFPEFYRIIIGCSSWGPGQLESELLGSRTKGNSMWCNFPYTEDFMWKTDPAQQWNDGIEYSAKTKVTNYLNF